MLAGAWRQVPSAPFSDWLLALDPEAYLWLGLLAVVATPIGRVSFAAIAYARQPTG